MSGWTQVCQLLPLALLVCKNKKKSKVLLLFLIDTQYWVEIDWFCWMIVFSLTPQNWTTFPIILFRYENQLFEASTYVFFLLKTVFGLYKPLCYTGRAIRHRQVRNGWTPVPLGCPSATVEIVGTWATKYGYPKSDCRYLWWWLCWFDRMECYGFHCQGWTEQVGIHGQG